MPLEQQSKPTDYLFLFILLWQATSNAAVLYLLRFLKFFFGCWTIFPITRNGSLLSTDPADSSTVQAALGMKDSSFIEFVVSKVSLPQRV